MDIENVFGIVLAIAISILLVQLVLLCVCDEKSKIKDNTELRSISRRDETGTDGSSVCIDVAMREESFKNSEIPVESGAVNGGACNRNSSGTNSHSREASSGSVQLRPTSLRELPVPPVANQKHAQSGSDILDKVTGAIDGGCYDHLGNMAANKTATNYDHISLESPAKHNEETPLLEQDLASDGHYAQVRERTYAVVKEVNSVDCNPNISPDYDLYAKVKDDDDKEDPYAEVKDTGEAESLDDDYAHLKHDHGLVVPSPGSKPSKVLLLVDDEDPYERVGGDSGGIRVQVGRTAAVKDDPYSVVLDLSLTEVQVQTGPERPKQIQTSGRSSVNSLSTNLQSNNAGTKDHFHLDFVHEDHALHDDYATVVKENSSRENEEESGGGEEEIQPYFTSPPEPPRVYRASEINNSEETEEEDGLPRAGHDSRQETKEHKYTKVTARESLASMTARHALNTYETVQDLPENTYATVEGGSGDGVVRYGVPTAQGRQLQHSPSQISDTYAEISNSASGSYTPSVPEPPSLDSLHSMTKSTSNEGDRDHGHSMRALSSPAVSQNAPSLVCIADDGYAVVSRTSNFSPSETALPQIPRTGTPGLVYNRGNFNKDVSKDIMLHPDYHRVKDCIVDGDSENDPNYESVDEALSKVKLASLRASASPNSNNITSVSVKNVSSDNATSPSRRKHQYEEVSPSSSPMLCAAHSPGTFTAATSGLTPSDNYAGKVKGEAAFSGMVGSQKCENKVRERVLQGHMYEDISEVQNNKKAVAKQLAGGEDVCRLKENKHNPGGSFS